MTLFNLIFSIVCVAVMGLAGLAFGWELAYNYFIKDIYNRVENILDDKKKLNRVLKQYGYKIVKIEEKIKWQKKDLQNYISSLNNDKDVDLNLTDVEKAVNHGFDKKTSFRNM